MTIELRYIERRIDIPENTLNETEKVLQYRSEYKLTNSNSKMFDDWKDVPIVKEEQKPNYFKNRLHEGLTMTESKLKERAGQAFEFSHNLMVVPLHEAIESIKAEREACAKVCSDRSIDEPGKLPIPEAYKEEAMLCASYIRARNNKNT